MRHPLHSLCPYFAMFPEEFVAKQVLAYTQRGDVVFDPFCGRGTTVFESLLNGRQSAGVDINPVAACVAGAKADPPTLSAVACRLTELEEVFQGMGRAVEPPESFSKLVSTNGRFKKFYSCVALLFGGSHASIALSLRSRWVASMANHIKVRIA